MLSSFSDGVLIAWANCNLVAIGSICSVIMWAVSPTWEFFSPKKWSKLSEVYIFVSCLENSLSSCLLHQTQLLQCSVLGGTVTHFRKMFCGQWVNFWAFFEVEFLRIHCMNLWPHQVRALFGYDLGHVNTCSFFGWLVSLRVTRVHGL